MPCRHFVVTSVPCVVLQQHMHHSHRFKRTISNYKKKKKKEERKQIIIVFFNTRIRKTSLKQEISTKYVHKIGKRIGTTFALLEIILFLKFGSVNLITLMNLPKSYLNTNVSAISIGRN